MLIKAIGVKHVDLILMSVIRLQGIVFIVIQTIGSRKIGKK